MEKKLKRIPRILIAKPGLDGHDRGAHVLCKFLSSKGMEVVYSGLNQTPEAIVNTAMQEDVDAVGLSILSGAHMTYFVRVQRLFEDQNEKILLLGGGIIPEEDKCELARMGIKAFTPGTPLEEIWTFLKPRLFEEAAT
ncbi:MAG: cobalamin B12-binding domain-containing protein [Deltaproteobacteria bacterium]|nr:cobalamin B12-binding domain-containing protein [Deltaproteobacteria bacterium]MBW2342941.1 cobalamin B12-binding domain-containing protein [Deltaproteobacteria bacterium]